MYEMDDMERYLSGADMDHMFPELYHRMRPKIHECISRHVKEKGEEWEPNKREMDKMTDEIYEKMIREYPEIDQDMDERRFRMDSEIDAMQRPFFGRRRLFRDLIGITLLGTFLHRRRRRRRRRHHDFF